MSKVKILRDLELLKGLTYQILRKQVGVDFVFLTSILTSLTSEVKGHDVNLFRIIMGGHIPIFVKNGPL